MTRRNNDCPHCKRRDAVVRPHIGWRVAVGVSWLTFTALVAGSAFIGFLLPFVAPILLFSGVSLLSFVHRKAFEEPTCAACGKLARPLPARVVELGRGRQVDLAA